jgi:ATP-dependent 26S proteasome regulatory subunit
MSQQLRTYIGAKHPLIWLETVEAERGLETVVAEVAALDRMNGTETPIKRWSASMGLSVLGGDEKDNERGLIDPEAILQRVMEDSTRAVYVLMDYHPFLDPGNPGNYKTISLAKEIAITVGNASPEYARWIILLSPVVMQPVELKGLAAVVELPLPDKKMIGELLDALGLGLKGELREAVVAAAAGLTFREINNAVAGSLVSLGRVDAGVVMQEKKQILRQAGGLEWIEPDPGGMSSIGGLENVKAWLKDHKLGFSEAARVYGLPIPKGVLFAGVQGCGKSAAIKCIPTEFGMPLIRLNMGATGSKFQGETEGNVSRALKVAEAVAPCVLWLEEIDKSLQSGGGEIDGGTSGRVIQMLLTWMQEKTVPVFLAASANDVTTLKPELLRKGRWDEVFFVDLPTKLERRAILEIHVGKRGRKPADLVTDDLVLQTAGFSGAELEQVIVDAMYRAFAEGVEVSLCHVIEAARETVPLSKLASDKIEELRKWAKGRTRPASASEKTASGNRMSAIEAAAISGRQPS